MLHIYTFKCKVGDFFSETEKKMKVSHMEK